MKKPLLKPKSRGQSLVEFALALPILLVIFLGIIQYGFMLYQKGLLTDIARDGARAAALYGTADSACKVIAKRGQDLGLPGIKGTISFDASDAKAALSFNGQIFTAYSLEGKAYYLLDPGVSGSGGNCS